MLESHLRPKPQDNSPFPEQLLSTKPERVDTMKRWLNSPIPEIWCAIGWVCASVVYYGLVTLLGGPTEGDSSESVYSTWAIAHGDLACAYPHLGVYHFNNLASPFALTGPLYPLVTGAAAAVLRIGSAVAFPPRPELGANCSHAFVAFFNWSVSSSAILPTIRLSYLMWPILLAGTVSLVRATGRGRRRWELLAVLMVACTPSVLVCLTFFFHPQDLLAMGLILAGLACGLRKRWVWAGVLLGLACLAQQYALLVAAPLLVIAPGRERLKYAGGAAVGVAVIAVPFIVATSGRAIKNLLLGSSRVGIINRSTGGTVLWEANIRGSLLFLLSRVAPIVAAMALAWWASKRLGPGLLTSVPLLSVVAASLAFRLVFEENLFVYYFMAISVALVVLEVASGHIRGTVLAWLALVSVAFNPVHAGFFSNLTGHTLDLYYATPIVIFALVAVTVMYDAVHHRVRAYKIMWLLLAALTCESKLWGMRTPVFDVPHWLWQVILVPTALVLATGPLLALIRQGRQNVEVEPPSAVTSP